MALGNNNSAIYLTIADGKIVRRFKDKTSNSKERVLQRGPNAGKIVHEEHYDFVQGIIKDIQVKDSKDYGKNWNVVIEDEGETYILQMDYSGGYSSAFLKMLPNVDLESHVKISPKITIDGEKKKASLFIMQHGEAVKWYYTKDNPNGLPELEQKKVKGKVVYDDSDIMEFLEKMVNTEILPKLKNFKEVAADVEDETEDAPF